MDVFGKNQLWSPGRDYIFGFIPKNTGFIELRQW